MKILVFPKDKNPYQHMLYTHMPKDMTITYLPVISHTKLMQLFLLFFQVILYRLKGFDIFHLHWLYPFTMQSKRRLFRKAWKVYTFFYIIAFFVFIKLLGFRLVYTFHNITPHEKQTINDEYIARFLSRIAAAKIVHSKKTIDQLKKIQANTDNIHIIPLGSYVGVYPHHTTKAVARTKLRIHPHKFTFLFFGQVRRYKGLDTLLKVFTKLLKKNPDIQLVIAGRCRNQDLRDLIIQAKTNLKHSFFPTLKTIPNHELQYYFSAADIAVLPFKRVTISSSILLAFSFDTPAIYPEMGNLQDLPDTVGYSYNPHDYEGLEKAMITAIQNKSELKKMEENAISYAQSLSWEKVAAKTYNLYKSL